MNGSATQGLRPGLNYPAPPGLLFTSGSRLWKRSEIIGGMTWTSIDKGEILEVLVGNFVARGLGFCRRGRRVESGEFGYGGGWG